MVLVRPRIWPETTETAPNSPIARALQMITPYSSPHLIFGSVTRKNVCQPLAPSVIAATSSSVPLASITGISSRATNGKVTKMVASTIPGTAKMILMLCAISQPPNHPCAPNISTKIMPEITGETANGRSISVVSRFLPRKSNCAIAHDAARPKTMLSGTAIAAVSSVKLDRGARLGIGNRREVKPDALVERLGEDRDQRDDQEQAEEAQRNADDQAPRPRRILGRAAHIRRRLCDRHPAVAARRCRSRPQPATWRDALQRCSRLIPKSIVKEITSITSAIAVAPW